MSYITVKLLKPEYRGGFHCGKFASDADRIVSAIRHIIKGHYDELDFEICFTHREDVQVAEFMFDVTNNPSREEERESLYGDHRSISVGDLVCINGHDFLCMPNGWEMLC
jgi:hypothetical protein